MHDLQGFENKRFIALGSLMNIFLGSGQPIRWLLKTRFWVISMHNSGNTAVRQIFRHIWPAVHVVDMHDSVDSRNGLQCSCFNVCDPDRGRHDIPAWPRGSYTAFILGIGRSVLWRRRSASRLNFSPPLTKPAASRLFRHWFKYPNEFA